LSEPQFSEKCVDGGKLARNGQKAAILAGGWGRLTIDDEYTALLWRLFAAYPISTLPAKCVLLLTVTSWMLRQFEIILLSYSMLFITVFSNAQCNV
jgi:hypothetical protein